MKEEKPLDANHEVKVEPKVAKDSLRLNNVQPSPQLVEVLLKIEDKKNKSQKLNAGTSSPKVERYGRPSNAYGYDMDAINDVVKIMHSEESPTSSPARRHKQPSNMSFQAHSGNHLSSPSKTNSIIGPKFSHCTGTINSKYIDKNVHASIERIKGFERHKRQVNLIMN